MRKQKFKKIVAPENSHNHICTPHHSSRNSNLAINILFEHFCICHPLPLGTSTDLPWGSKEIFQNSTILGNNTRGYYSQRSSLDTYSFIMSSIQLNHPTNAKWQLSNTSNYINASTSKQTCHHFERLTAKILYCILKIHTIDTCRVENCHTITQYTSYPVATYLPLVKNTL